MEVHVGRSNKQENTSTSLQRADICGSELHPDQKPKPVVEERRREESSSFLFLVRERAPTRAPLLATEDMKEWECELMSWIHRGAIVHATTTAPRQRCC